MRHLGGSSAEGEEEDIGGDHHGTVAPQESKIRPTGSRGRISTANRLHDFSSPLVAFSLLPVVSAFDELGSWLWCGVDGKQEGGEREGMDGLLSPLAACPALPALPLLSLPQLLSVLLLQFMDGILLIRVVRMADGLVCQIIHPKDRAP